MSNVGRLAVGTVVVIAAVACGTAPRVPSSPGQETSPMPVTSASTSPPRLVPPGSIEAGSYLLKSGDAGLGPPVVVTVPEGWSSICFNACNAVASSEQHGAAAVLGYLTVDNVYADPCGHVLRDPPIGRSVDELANALVALPGTDAVQPVATTLDGRPAMYLEFTVGEDVGCLPGSVYLYDATSATSHSDGDPDLLAWTRWSQAAGQRFLYWVVDLDGQRVLIEASWVPHTSGAELAELFDIVESIRFGTWGGV